MFSLKEKTAIISGGSKGIGKSIAFKYAEAGANVVICSRKKDNLNSAIEEAQTLGFNIIGIECNTGEIESINNVVDKTLEQFKLYSQYLKSNRENIIKQFNSKPKAHWKKNDNSFSIFVNDKMPVSNIKLSFISDKPEWVSIDENYNGLVDKNEMKFFSNNEEDIYIPATIYSNRIKVTSC